MSKNVSKGLRRATSAKEKDVIFARLREVMIRMGKNADGEDVADYPGGMSDATIAKELNVPAGSVGFNRREVYGNFPRKSPAADACAAADDVDAAGLRIELSRLDQNITARFRSLRDETENSIANIGSRLASFQRDVAAADNLNGPLLNRLSSQLADIGRRVVALETGAKSNAV